MIKKLLIILLSVGIVISNGLYRININNVPAGFFRYSLEQEGSNYKMDCRTFIKVSFMGNDAVTSLEATTSLEDNFLPIDYSLEVLVNERTIFIDCSFAADTVGMQIIQDDDTTNTSVMLDSDTYILDNSVFGHFFPLVKLLDFKETQPLELAIFVPQIFRKSFMQVRLGSEMEYRGKPARRVHFDFMSNNARAIIDPSSREVLFFEITGENINLTKVENLDTVALKDIGFASVMDGHLNYAKSNVEIARPYLVDKMIVDAVIPVTILEMQSSNNKFYFDSYHQDFEGKVDDGIVQGRFTIEAKSYDADKAKGYPHEDFFGDLSVYFMASKDFPTGDSLIAAKAKEITADDKNRWQAMESITSFIADSLSYSMDNISATRAFITREGDALAKSKLAITMLRTLGIPARLVGGIIYTNRHFSEHFWGEVLVDDENWIPFDPTTRELEFFSAVHITLWEGYAKIDNRKNVFTVDVEEFNMIE